MTDQTDSPHTVELSATDDFDDLKQTLSAIEWDASQLDRVHIRIESQAPVINPITAAETAAPAPAPEVDESATTDPTEPATDEAGGAEIAVDGGTIRAENVPDVTGNRWFPVLETLVDRDQWLHTPDVRQFTPNDASLPGDEFTQYLYEMVEYGLAEKKPSDEDGRMNVYKATSKGQAAVAVAHDAARTPTRPASPGSAD